MKSNNKVKYHGSMGLLYSMSLLAWNLYLKHWNAFKVLNDKYTEAYGNNMLAATEAAKAMPDVAQRRGNTENAVNSLQTAAAKALLLWKRLERLIIKACPPAEQHAAILQAGGTHCTKAARFNYASLSLLLAAGTDFIINNTAKLQQAGMTAQFPTDYATALARFMQEYALCANARTNATNNTTGKVQANNALFDSMMELFDDAQTLFEEEAHIRRQFTYTAVRNLVTKDVVCGIHFVVKDKETKKPVPNATITFTAQQESYAVNKRGVLGIKLQKGTYKVVVSVPDYTPVMLEVTADAGVMHRVIITLQKMDAAA